MRPQQGGFNSAVGTGRSQEWEGFSEKQLLVLHDGRASKNNASDEEIEAALYNAALVQSRLQTAAYKLNAFDVQMAGTRRVMRAGLLPRSFSSFCIQMPRVVFSTLGLETSFLIGSAVWGSGSDEETQSEQDQMEYQNEKAKEEAAAGESKREQAFFGLTPKPN